MNSLLICLIIFFTGCMGDNGGKYQENKDKAFYKEERAGESHSHLTVNDSVRHIVDHPAFQEFARHLLPWNDNSSYYDVPLTNVHTLMPYHSHVQPQVVVDALNHLIDEINHGKTVFYEFYTEEQQKNEPAKSSTGLFFFRGKPGAPFAVVCPGGGFSYVGSLHEGFPHAVKISEMGYNVFVIDYRVGSNVKATEDLAAAISYIFDKAEQLEVNTQDYSLWGSSAGARMVGDICLNGVASYGGADLPKPSAAVIAYTGHTSFSENYPPTFITVSQDDRIVNTSVVDRRVKNLREAGIDVAYRKYENAGHGFGIGVDTDAEGWLEQAVRFWEKHKD